jgi:outer membrane PBP1 activator LpoA protein
MYRGLPTVSVAVLAALVLAGCGSQSHKPSKLVAAADPICRSIAERREQANAQLRTVSKSSTETLALMARLAPEVSAYEHHETQLLASLKVSGSQARSWQALLAGIKALADDTTRLGVEARAKNLSALRATIASGERLQQQLGAIAGKEGFVYCGRTS